MAQEKHILIVCGEASGDLNAALLVKALKEINPHIQVSGVGGIHLRASGASVFYDIKKLSVMGFFDVLKKLPAFFSLKKLILEKIKNEKPACIILVDFSGFNLRLAKAINKAIPTIYYVSPQVWASRQGRIRTIKKYISKLIVIFRFEREFYKKHGIEVDFVGHPLLDTAIPLMNKRDFFSTYALSSAKTTLLLLPGSRRSEIAHILPVMLESTLYMQKRMKDMQCIIAKSPYVDLDIYYRIIRKLNAEVKIIEGKTYDCINAADFCMVCSGTATLETAIMQKPFVIVYKMNTLNYLLYRPQVKVPYIGMVNIVAQKRIVPEFIQLQATPENIANKVIKILQNPPLLEEMQRNLSQIKSLLGEKGASSRAARIIVDFLH